MLKINYPEKERPKISIGDLMRQCNTAASKMGVQNSHRGLLLNCASAMQQLVDRLEASEARVKQLEDAESKLILQ